MSEKNCGTCANCYQTTHKYDKGKPKRVLTVCEEIPCVVFGEWADRCSASALVTPEFSCALWEAKEEDGR